MSAHGTEALPVDTTGLLGGAFDPPHNGHLVVAHEAMRQLVLGRLLVVVTGAAPHKRVETPASIRLRLAELAFAELDDVEVSRIELDREGPSYTLDTVRWARERYGETTFIVGADEFASFLDWHEPDSVLDAARLAVATRPGFTQHALDAVLANLRRPDRVHFFTIPDVPVSSREIRRRISAGLPVDGMMPENVCRAVAELEVYCNAHEDDPVRSEGMNPTREGS